jgi:hypothetical protein
MIRDTTTRTLVRVTTKRDARLEDMAAATELAACQTCALQQVGNGHRRRVRREAEVSYQGGGAGAKPSPGEASPPFPFRVTFLKKA